ncbi:MULTISPECIES: hypothetical protein [Sphingomonadales]|jgi:hypothetical protein|uniref:DUF1173 domain-containing protein n=6 Tax=Sphingomonadales TaxID=204457 RepID=A0A1E1F8A9_9SPHN|nr:MULTISPECIES: hypothetical protein [Sphingomonadaceae]EPR17169.1 hypothetical protein M527_17625 [Sphingobium indicum IP26]EZP70289.1 hypothetical protein BV96_03532 [Sphingomonas paucimobilis]MBW7950208.1 hypothetical protein [Pseudorhodoplanes sp.]AMK20546.1 hypothetical protein K663_20948 [Sphingobium sp. MI1205]AMK21348.1 hypothetical protein K426_01935 [Sphingobium sp. TKS]
MWLIPRNTDGTRAGRIALPAPVREALVRWYVGQGSRADEEAGIMLVQQARIGERWIACDCLSADAPPPILTPAFLSEAETYYLRRLTSVNRPEHRADCPFFRDQATNRLSEVRTQESPADPPTGYFEVLRPAPEKLAQRPEEESSDDRTRQASVPRLARLLWRLINLSGLNRTLCLSDENPEHSISDEFKTLAIAAQRVEIAPGIELGRALWTHAQALHSKRIYARLRELSRVWPPGHAPQGFLALFTQKFEGSTIHVAGSDPVVLANRVQSPSIRGNTIKGPYLTIVVAGQYPEAHGYAPLRGYAQPIYSGKRFIPVDSEFERAVLRDLLRLRWSFDRAGLDLLLEKPVFDTLTPIGSCRPDFLLEARSRSTGETREIIVEAMGSTDETYLAAKAVTHPRMQQIAPVLCVSPDDVEEARIAPLVRKAFGL